MIQTYIRLSKNLLNLGLCLYLTIVSIGCGALSSYSDWVDANYYVADSPSEPSNKTLYIANNAGGHGRIEWVKRIGRNQMFIIAESEDGLFWILDKTKDNELLNADQIVIGPFSKTEFQQKKIEMKISNLEFTDNF
jgi:hypothetical protein